MSNARPQSKSWIGAAIAVGCGSTLAGLSLWPKSSERSAPEASAPLSHSQPIEQGSGELSTELGLSDGRTSVESSEPITNLQNPFLLVKAGIEKLLATEQLRELPPNERARLRHEIIFGGPSAQEAENKQTGASTILADLVDWRRQAGALSLERGEIVQEQEWLRNSIRDLPDIFGVVMLSGRDLTQSNEREEAWRELIILTQNYAGHFSNVSIDQDSNQRLPIGDALLALETVLVAECASTYATDSSLNTTPRSKFREIWSALCSEGLYFERQSIAEIRGKKNIGQVEEKHFGPSRVDSLVSRLSSVHPNFAVAFATTALTDHELSSFWHPASKRDVRIQNLAIALVEGLCDQARSVSSTDPRAETSLAVAIDRLLGEVTLYQKPKKIFQLLVDVACQFDLSSEHVRARLNSISSSNNDMAERALCFQALATHGRLELPEIAATLKAPGLELQIAAADAAGKLIIERSREGGFSSIDPRLTTSKEAQALLEGAAHGKFTEVSIPARTMALFSLLGCGPRDERLRFFEELAQRSDTSDVSVSIGAIVCLSIEIEAEKHANELEVLARNSIRRESFEEVRTVAFEGFLRSTQTQMFELLKTTPPKIRSTDVIAGFREELRTTEVKPERRDRIDQILLCNDRFLEVWASHTALISEASDIPMPVNGLMQSSASLDSWPVPEGLKRWRSEQHKINNEVLSQKLRSGFGQILNLRNYL